MLQLVKDALVSTKFFFFPLTETCWKDAGKHWDDMLLWRGGGKKRHRVSAVTDLSYSNAELTEGDSREESTHVGWKSVCSLILPWQSL